MTNRSRQQGDTLSLNYHSTPAPQSWNEWPDVPTETSHVPKKKRFLAPGQNDMSDPHIRTLVLQVYRDMLLAQKKATSYQELVKILFTRPSVVLEWSFEGKVLFPASVNETTLTGSGSRRWNLVNSTPEAINPLLITKISNDAAKLLSSVFEQTNWSKLAANSRLQFAVFPSARYLSRVVCHSRAIIGVMCGQARLAWTTPELFYSGLDVVRGTNQRHRVDYDFVDNQTNRDFHRVDRMHAGACMYVRTGAAIQLFVQANTILVMLIDADVEPHFERLIDWLVRIKGMSRLNQICPIIINYPIISKYHINTDKCINTY